MKPIGESIYFVKIKTTIIEELKKDDKDAVQVVKKTTVKAIPNPTQEKINRALAKGQLGIFDRGANQIILASTTQKVLKQFEKFEGESRIVDERGKAVLCTFVYDDGAFFEAIFSMYTNQNQQTEREENNILSRKVTIMKASNINKKLSKQDSKTMMALTRSLRVLRIVTQLRLIKEDKAEKRRHTDQLTKDSLRVIEDMRTERHEELDRFTIKKTEQEKERFKRTEKNIEHDRIRGTSLEAESEPPSSTPSGT